MIKRNFRIICCDGCHKNAVFIEGGDKMNRKSIYRKSIFLCPSCFKILCPSCFKIRFPNTHAVGVIK